ncbi:leucine Rich Repeat protein [Porphyromonas asaccharolytica PR426713P-I]|uniref:T9SS type A sorting domain-containing protein n=1 Tax=Porphyromonas asaccharolytica TaxID=28123 RepID=UPI0001EB2827|nr:T9SS type A sorting domain-containing protein [Porphyromonas asaccharolytica]EFR34626.1 leucine Rich Repeat protein [Porphyromonas asaccharolytica PR426713P-I]
MTRRLHHWACVLLCTLLTTIGLQAEVTPSITNLPSESLRTGSDGVITMTTSGAVGEQIMLAVSPVEGQNVIAEGLKEPLVLDGTEHLYTLTSQTVTLRGNLTHLACDEMKDSSIPTDHRNQLTSLDVSGCKTLTYLDCSNNLLQSLDITHNEALTELFCGGNQLTSLDLSHARALTTLVCYENKLTQLDLSSCTKLTGLGVGDNQLTHLDVSQLKKLKFLECDGNQLIRLDVSHNDELQGLACYGNQIKDEAMTELVNGLPSRIGKDPHGQFVVVGEDAKADGNICLKSDVLIAKLKNWSVLTSDFRTEYDGEPDPAPNPNTPVGDGVITMTTSRAVGEQIMLAVSPVKGQNVIAEGLKESLILDGTGHLYTLTSQTVTLRGNLILLQCDGAVDMETPPSHENQLTSLDINCETLTLLSCSGNPLTSLDLSHARALTALACYENKLTQLDLSPCTKLTGLGVGENQLTHLDVSHNGELEILDCYGNQIKGEAMTELVNGLPDRRGKEPGIFQVIGMDAQTDGNICLKSDVAIAKGKNWSVQSFSGDYEGEDPTYSVTLTKEGEGTLTVTGADDLDAVPYDTELTVIATPAEGYELTALTANGTDILATKKFVVKGATEVKATFVDHTSVGEVGTETMRLYPNPAREYIIVEGTLPATLVTLYSMEGMRLYEDETDAEGTLRIDLSAYAEGTYLLRIADQIHRIIVQH